MKVNTNHPSFISFLENVTNAILTDVNVDNYFSLPQEKKMGVLYMVFKLIKKATSVRARLSDDDLKSFINFLWKRNELSENYEFAAVLKDIFNNFEAVSEFTKPVKRAPRTIKTDKKDNVN